MARLILDTTLLIAAARNRLPLRDLLADDDDLAVAAITAAELLVGVELADAARRPTREAFVADVLDTVPVEPYDLRVARVHAALLTHARRAGRPRGAHDLVIAATARAHERAVVSADPRGFDDLPGVETRPAA